MAEYIRKEDALDAVKHAWAKGIEPSQYIESLEPVDVVPVVRSDDAVSRKAVKSMTCNHCGRIDCEGEDNCIRMIDVSDLPSVVRHEKMGMWVLHTYMPHKKYCSECGEDSPYNKRWIFCPNCGAKMDGKRREE